MKKISATIILIVSFMLIIPPVTTAASRYKKSVWPSSLTKGVLKVRGPGYGKWGKSWITVDSGVKKYWEVGTSKGPVIIYTKGAKNWKILQLHFSTGAKQNLRSFSRPVSLVRGGRYGAIIKVGNVCYDFSWAQLKQKKNCK